MAGLTVHRRNPCDSASVSATIESTSSLPTTLDVALQRAGMDALRADLSAYAGWQWSLFYRPEAQLWRLVLSTDALAGVPGRGVWGAAGIDGDRSAAREHVERAARVSRGH